MHSVLRAVGALLLLSLWARVALAQELGPLPDGAEPITDRQTLYDLLVDTTHFGVFPQHSNEKWSEYYCRNGKSIFVLGSDLEAGRWWVAAPEACFSYHWPDGEETYCYLTYALPDGTYLMRSDAHQLDAIIQGRLAGDAFHMQRLKGMACEDLSS